jgi:hypothetical protein
VAPILPVTSLNGRTGAVTLTKSDVGLANADNTSDAAKPISTAAQAALDLKAPLASPTFTGTVSGVSTSMVGLGNADNTADIDKPVSNPVQLALNAKSNTGHTHAVADTTGLQAALDAKAPLASPAFTGTPTGITKSHVGLGNVDNTSDAAKPLSTAATSALAAKAPLASPTFTGTVTLPTTTNGLTKSNVGLGNVDNTADTAKPVSTAQQTALNAKVDTTAKGAANGVASLDANGQIPVAQLPKQTGSASVSIAANVLATQSVTFATPFAAAPNIQVTKTSGAAPKYIPYVASKSATGFTIGLYSADGTTQTTTQSVDWVANAV